MLRCRACGQRAHTQPSDAQDDGIDPAIQQEARLRTSSPTVQRPPSGFTRERFWEKPRAVSATTAHQPQPAAVIAVAVVTAAVAQPAAAVAQPATSHGR